MKLIEYLPDYYFGSREMVAYQNAIEPQNDRLNEQLEDMGRQVFVSSATWGIENWETALGIRVEAYRPLSERRARVTAKLRGRGTTTRTMLENVAQSYYPGPVEVAEHNEEYWFDLLFYDTVAIPDGLKDLRATIEEIKPAHLAYKLRFLTKPTNLYSIQRIKSQLSVQVLADNLGMRRVYLDGGYLLDGSWLLGGVTALGVKFRELAVAVKGRTANYISSAYVKDNTWRWDGPRLMNAGPFTYSLSPVQVAVAARQTGRAWAGFGVRAAGRNRAWAGMEGVGLTVRGRSGEHTGAAATLDTMWRLDGSRALDGGRKLNADIVTVEL